MATKVTLPDQALRRKILAALGRDAGTLDVDLDVVVSDGVAMLAGRVESWAQRLAVERVAQAIKGLRMLVLVLEVRPETAYRHSDREIALAAVQRLQWNGVVPVRTCSST